MPQKKRICRVSSSLQEDPFWKFIILIIDISQLNKKQQNIQMEINKLLVRNDRAKLSKEDKEKIIKLYNEGIGSEILAKQFQVSGQSILKMLKKNNIKIRPKIQKISKEDKINIIKLYQDGLSTPKIASKYKVTHTIIVRILKQNNIKARDESECHRKYKINEHFFDNIDSEEKAYFLGFLYADGCNLLNHNMIRIDLNQIDYDILYKFSKLIYLENPEYHVKIHNREHEGKNIYAYLSISSKHMCQKLEEAGCLPRKTWTLKWPQFLNNTLYRHLIRGFFDGDGSIYKTNNIYSFSFIGNYEFITGLQNYITEILNIKTSKKKAHNCECYIIKGEGNRKTIQFMNWIYKDSTIYMNRKFEKYQQLTNRVEEINDKIKEGTQGFSKIILTKYGSFSEQCYDGTNSENPILINNKNITLGPDNIPLTAEYIWVKQGIERVKLIDWVFNFYRNKGFPYYKDSYQNMINTFSKLENENPNKILNINENIKNYNSIGTNIIKNFADTKLSTAHVNKSLSSLDVFNSDDLFIKVLKNRMGFNKMNNGRPYIYSISDLTIRNGIVASGLSMNISNFKPLIAKYIYKTYCNGNKVFDFSGGWGGRLLGAISLGLEYSAIDPLTYDILNNISSFLNKKAIIQKGISEDFSNLTLEKYDMAFSCPPYFDVEEYSKEDSQSYIKYNNYNLWLEKYWENTVKNCYEILNNNAIFAVCLPIKYKNNILMANDMTNIINKYLKMIKIYDIISPKSHLNKTNKEEIKEKIFIYKKIAQKL